MPVLVTKLRMETPGQGEALQLARELQLERTKEAEATQKVRRPAAAASQRPPPLPPLLPPACIGQAAGHRLIRYRGASSCPSSSSSSCVAAPTYV
jgi:hypothetical protein